jgi:hypothetical protein
MIDLDHLESLAKAATPGPWRVGTYPLNEIVGDTHVCIDTDIGAKVLLRGNENFYEEARMNAIFAAAANPSAILDLCAEVRRLRELLGSIPRTPEAAIAFIGSQFNSMRAQGWTETFPSEPTGDLSMVTYSLSVHDLLSAFSWAGLSGEDIDAAQEKQ